MFHPSSYSHKNLGIILDLTLLFTLHIPSIRKPCWPHPQKILRFSPFSSLPPPGPWSRRLSSLTWIISITSCLHSCAPQPVLHRTTQPPVNTYQVTSPSAQNPAVAHSELKGQRWISSDPRAHSSLSSPVLLFPLPLHSSPTGLFAILVPGQAEANASKGENRI